MRQLRDDGAEIVDVRPLRAFAAAHIPGSLSIPLRPQFASWLGWLVSDVVPLVFLRDDSQDGAEVVRQALGIGYERLAGELAGDIDAWRRAGLPVARMPLVEAAAVAGPVLDVRQDNEYAAGHLPGAIHVELGRLSTAAADLPGNGLTAMCAHGERAATAASVLERAGRTGVAVAVGGPHEWSTAHGALATES